MSDVHDYRVDLIRHGEPHGGDLYRGRSIDHPLSDRGWRQMREAVTARGPWDVIVHSPMRRCAEFALELAQAQAVPAESDPGFREISFGHWEGLTAQQIEQAQPGELGRYWRDPVSHCPPGGEALSSFADMVGNAWQKLLDRYPRRQILIVTHGGTIRALLASMLDIPLHAMLRIEVPYACMSQVRVHRDDDGVCYLSLVSHGATASS